MTEQQFFGIERIEWCKEVERRADSVATMSDTKTQGRVDEAKV